MSLLTRAEPVVLGLTPPVTMLGEDPVVCLINDLFSCVSQCLKQPVNSPPVLCVDFVRT